MEERWKRWSTRQRPNARAIDAKSTPKDEMLRTFTAARGKSCSDRTASGAPVIAACEAGLWYWNQLLLPPQAGRAGRSKSRPSRPPKIEATEGERKQLAATCYSFAACAKRHRLEPRAHGTWLSAADPATLQIRVLGTRNNRQQWVTRPFYKGQAAVKTLKITIFNYKVQQIIAINGIRV